MSDFKILLKSSQNLAAFKGFFVFYGDIYLVAPSNGYFFDAHDVICYICDSSLWREYRILQFKTTNHPIFPYVWYFNLQINIPAKFCLDLGIALNAHPVYFLLILNCRRLSSILSQIDLAFYNSHLSHQRWVQKYWKYWKSIRTSSPSTVLRQFTICLSSEHIENVYSYLQVHWVTLMWIGHKANTHKPNLNE